MSVLQLINGPNFSGRTTALRALVKNERDREGRPVAYVGPEVFTSFSGLAGTVAGELELLNEGSADGVVDALGIQHLLDRNLSSVSGGEEVLCAIGASLALCPRTVALDCVLEQLDHGRRIKALRALKESPAETVSLADNRFREWIDGDVTVHDLTPIQDSSCLYFPIDASAPLAPRTDKANDIVISRLWCRYGRGPWVLKDINIKLPASRIIHLAGDNGAGKSTLAKVLVGAIIPSEGTITHRDLNAPWKNPGRLAAYHFQNPDMQLFRSTVLDELTVGAGVRGRDKTTVEELVQSAAAAFGLQNVLEKHPQELPFSVRKRVAMAATVACGTPWIILDEPTLGQDDYSAEQLATYIIRLASSGAGVIIISHSESFVSRVPAERVILRDGTVCEVEDG